MKLQNRKTPRSTLNYFSLEKELCKHAWFPQMTVEEAKQALEGKSQFTYLLRKRQNNVRKYDISYVDANGKVQHDTFTLINPKLGIFQNGQHSHLGKLEKVVRDMMHCERHQGQPLTS